MPSIRFSKHRCIACCFSGGWLFTMLLLRSEKYWGQEWDRAGRGEKMEEQISPPSSAGSKDGIATKIGSFFFFFF